MSGSGSERGGRTLSRLWWFPRLTPWPLMLPATRLGFRLSSFLSVLGSPIRPASTLPMSSASAFSASGLTLPYHSPAIPQAFPLILMGESGREWIGSNVRYRSGLAVQ